MFRLIGALGVLGVLMVQSPERTVWEGVYTAKQAERGKSAYAELCSSCHQANMLGGGQVPSLTGEGFVSAWDGLTIRDLFSRLRTTMPADKPGSLDEKVTIDIVAYLLETNSFPGGEKELEVDRDALQKIRISKTK